MNDQHPKSRAGMLADVMFGYRGRIGRLSFWLGLIASLAIAGLISSLVAETFDNVGAFGRSLSVMAIAGLFVWMTSAVTIKRQHDRNRSGWWYPLYGLAPPGSLLGAIHLHGEGVLEAASMLYVVSFFAWVWVLIDLGMMRGTAGPNRYGPEPP